MDKVRKDGLAVLEKKNKCYDVLIKGAMFFPQHFQRKQISCRVYQIKNLIHIINAHVLTAMTVGTRLKLRSETGLKIQCGS